MKPYRPKLESRFILDVTILDGTLIAPNTPFTKIWRMRNNGKTMWPFGTQLQWIGGETLGNRVSVELEVSETYHKFFILLQGVFFFFLQGKKFSYLAKEFFIFICYIFLPFSQI